MTVVFSTVRKAHVFVIHPRAAMVCVCERERERERGLKNLVINEI